MSSTYYRTVIVELDALLASASDGRAAAWTTALGNAGYDVAFAEVRQRIGMGPERLLAELAGLSPDSAAARTIEEDFRSTFESVHLERVSVLPGARDLLARFGREGYVIVLTSSGDSDSRAMHELLRHVQLANAFDEAMVLPRGARSKPAPDLVLSALERTRTPASQAVVIGDTPHDLAAARAACVPSIGLSSGGWPPFSLSGSVAVYREPVDLLDNFEMSPLSRSSAFEHLFAPVSANPALAL